MKARMNIRSIIMVMATICLASMFFINICFATSTGKITTETARLREQPNTEAKVLELASLGEELEILEELDGWYKVKYKKITGYIRSDLMEVENKVEDSTTNTVEIDENATVETNTTIVEETTFEKGKYKILENTKLKIIPLISGIELEEVNKDIEVEVTEVLNNWAKIKTADGKEGWIITEKLVSIQENTTEAQPEESTMETVPETNQAETTKTMYVNSQTINLREEANTTSKVLKQLALNQGVTVLSNENGWYKVDVDGITGYISQSLLSDTKQETSRSATTERTTTQNATEQSINNTQTQTQATTSTTTENTTTSEIATSCKGEEVVAYAKQFLGCKYVYGGTTTSGFDCSGFTQYVYKHFGVNLNRTAAAQYSNGTSVTDLQAGDLVMFGKSGIDHVGIYIGGNTFIHAANASRGVTTDTLASGYYKTNYVGARRIFN